MKPEPVTSEREIPRIALETTPVRPVRPPVPVRAEERENVQDLSAELTRGEMQQHLEEMNEAVRLAGRALQFQLHERSERWQVFVIDLPTREVVKEIPPRELLDILGKIREMVGLLLDERV